MRTQLLPQKEKNDKITKWIIEKKKTFRNTQFIIGLVSNIKTMKFSVSVLIICLVITFENANCDIEPVVLVHGGAGKFEQDKKRA